MVAHGEAKMRQKPEALSDAAEKAVRDIKRATSVLAATFFRGRQDTDCDRRFAWRRQHRRAVLPSAALRIVNARNASRIVKRSEAEGRKRDAARASAPNAPSRPAVLHHPLPAQQLP